MNWCDDTLEALVLLRQYKGFTLTSTALGANGDDAEEHHLGERGFHHVACSEVESRYGSPSAVGCSHPPWAHISTARFAWVRQRRQQQQQHRIRIWVPKFLLWWIYGAYGCPQEEGTFSLLTSHFIFISMSNISIWVCWFEFLLSMVVFGILGFRIEV